MRLDRFITLNIARPFRAVTARDRTVLPILMYHRIAHDPEAGVLDYYRTATSPVQFRQQMALLKSQGYRGVDLTTGLNWLAEVGQASSLSPSHVGQASSLSQQPHDNPPPTSILPTRQAGSLSYQTDDNPPPTSTVQPRQAGSLSYPVVLTFDDGYRDFHTAALPILAEFGFTATMYLPTAFIQDERQSFKGAECMTWSEVRASQEMGIHFGAHTVSHAKLYETSWPEIKSELTDSKLQIEDRLGGRVTDFAYPYAFPQVDTAFCRRLRDLLAEVEYETCVTTIAGRVRSGDDPYTLRRLPVNGADDEVLLRAKLAGCYDWMEPAQRMAKRLKGIAAKRNGKVAPIPRSAGL